MPLNKPLTSESVLSVKLNAPVPLLYDKSPLPLNAPRTALISASIVITLLDSVALVYVPPSILLI